METKKKQNRVDVPKQETTTPESTAASSEKEIPLEEQLVRRQSAPRPTFEDEAQRMMRAQNPTQNTQYGLVEGMKAGVEKIGREEIAKELRTSKESLHLYFATVMKMDFRTWRTELRIEESKKLLLEDKETSINIIGEMAGFSDRANFYRQFVKIVGCSPKEWRESNGNPDLKS